MKPQKDKEQSPSDNSVAAKDTFGVWSFAMNRSVFFLICAAVFFLSLSVLVYEITLTRVFSLLFNYHYSFMAISLSLLGLGLGGLSTYTFLRKKPNIENTPVLLVYLVVSLSFSFFFIPQILTGISTDTDIYVYWVLTITPFFIAGVIFSLLFKVFSKNSNTVYFADLVGAGIACVLVIVFLDVFTGIEVIFLLSIFSSVAAVLFAVAVNKKAFVGISVVILLLFSLFFSVPLFREVIKDVTPKSDQGKDMLDFMKNSDAKIVESRWSPFGRTDLLESPNDLDRKFIFIDGAAGSAIYRFNGNINDRTNTAVYGILGESGGFLPYIDGGPKERVLIIGPGGGRDVLTALMGNATHITGVEVNEDTVELVRSNSDFNGGLYSNFDNVHIVVNEGRSFIKNSGEKYDIIALTLPLTKTSTGAAGYSLNENFLFTVDSMTDYLNHLTENGRVVVVTHGLGELLKITTTAVSAIEKRGESTEDAMKHIVVAGPHEHTGMWSAIMIRNRAYQQNESFTLHKDIMNFSYFSNFVPYVSWSTTETHQQDKCNYIISDLFALSVGIVSLDKLQQSASLDITPPTDDRPFFYKFERGLPNILSSLISYMLFFSILIIILPWGIRKYLYRQKMQATWKIRKRYIKQKKYLYAKTKERESNTHEEEHKRLLEVAHPEIENEHMLLTIFIPIFSLLGFGFMLIEIPLIQKFLLFLGHPTTAISVVLSALLVFGGVGSFISGKFSGEGFLKIYPRICLLIVLWVGVITILAPYIFIVFLGADLPLKVLVALMLLSPLMVIGMPFPMTLRLMSKNHESDIPWMWGINGVFSVTGSVFAVAIGMLAGFTYSILIGVVAYILIALLITYNSNSLKPHTTDKTVYTGLSNAVTGYKIRG
jgi:spermidine synthase